LAARALLSEVGAREMVGRVVTEAKYVGVSVGTGTTGVIVATGTRVGNVTGGAVWRMGARVGVEVATGTVDTGAVVWGAGLGSTVSVSTGAAVGEFVTGAAIFTGAGVGPILGALVMEH
jgi:hypothetical protein